MTTIPLTRTRLVIFLYTLVVLVYSGQAVAETTLSLSEVSTRLEAYEQRIHDLEASLTLTEASWNEYGEPDEGGPADCTHCCPGWTVSVDYLYWRAHRNDMGFAILDPGGLGVPSGGQPVMALDYDWDSGVRVELARQTTSGWELSFRYTHFGAQDRAAFAPGGGQVLAVSSSPATGLTNADSADAAAKLEMNLFDLEARHWLQPCDSILVGLSGGVRFGQINQDLLVHYDGGAFTNGLVQAPVDLVGVGGRVGGETHWLISDHFSLFGQAAVSLLAGNFEASRREVNAGAVVIDASNDIDRVVPIIELSMGGAIHRGPWTVTAGYELSNWFGQVAAVDFCDSFNGGSLDDGGRDLGFSGLFVRASFER